MFVLMLIAIASVCVNMQIIHVFICIFIVYAGEVIARKIILYD